MLDSPDSSERAAGLALDMMISGKFWIIQILVLIEVLGNCIALSHPGPTPRASKSRRNFASRSFSSEARRLASATNRAAFSRAVRPLRRPVSRRGLKDVPTAEPAEVVSRRYKLDTHAHDPRRER